MPDGSDLNEELSTVRLVGRMADIAPKDWDSCAGSDNPFISHAFLSALEESGSAIPETGWTPRHLVIENASGGLEACAPMYLKSHSHGEYVFDFGWAESYEQAGGRYYPKLLVGVPFTPAMGPRLLTAKSNPAGETALMAGLTAAARQLGVSSLHINFLPPDQWQGLKEAGFLTRTGCQFHWTNQGYESFDDFLKALSSRKRKAIRKEREKVARSEIKITALTGKEILESHWDSFYRFYSDTIARKWAYPYLTRDFFSLIGGSMGEKIVLVMAEDETGQHVACALNFLGNDCLFGRYWGCAEHHDFLHFELCYYRAIDYAIGAKLDRVEAGAQGRHKVQRGYLPTRTYSAHWLADPHFSKAVANFLDRERVETETGIKAYMEGSPYAKGA